MRLGHTFEVVVIDCLGFTEDSTSETLVGWNANHVVAIENQISHIHV